MATLALRNIDKSYLKAGSRVSVLSQCSLSVEAGETVALTGPSGCGKSTLLQIAGLVDVADAGSVRINGKDMSAASQRERTKARGNMLGFVYQFHHLLPEFTAQENIAMPLIIRGEAMAGAARKAQALLEEVGLADRASHMPAELSGGEQQRVAIARALIGEPQLLIADEPTGNLDPHNAQNIFQMLQNVCAARKLSVLMATHNLDLAKTLDRRIELG